MLSNKSSSLFTFYLLFSARWTLQAAGQCAGGIYADVANAVAGYTPASAFCSSRYPIPATTTTLTPSRSTVLSTSTVSVTVMGTAVTSTVTVAGATATTITSTATVTGPPATVVTYSVTSSAAKRAEPLIQRTDCKRSPKNTVSTSSSSSTKISTATTAAPSTTTAKSSTMKTSTSSCADKKACQWSSVLSEASAFIGSVCTCLETRKTVTVSATAQTTTSVVTTTVTTTQTSTVSTTVTSSPTVISTVTSTTTPSTTIKVVPTSRAPCQPAPGYDFGYPGFNCGSGCFCGLLKNGAGAFCTTGDSTVDCGGATCSSGEDCITDGANNYCSSYGGCTSSNGTSTTS